MPSSDERYMREALAEAEQAALVNEVPVGALVVLDDSIISRGHNCKEMFQDATAHAEIMALREAFEVTGSWRLSGATLYVTLEPCVMCCGALIQARVDRVVYGAEDPKFGGVASLYSLLSDERSNHVVSVTAGVLSDESSELLRAFFQSRRGD